MNREYELMLFAAVVLTLVVMVILLIKQRSKWRGIVNSIQEEKRVLTKQIQDKADADVRAAQQQAAAEVRAAQAEAAQAIETERKNCADALAAEQQRSAKALKVERERIAAEKADLLATPEKELLVRTVMALGGYGTRLDRIEAQRESLLQDLKRETSQIIGTESANLLKSFHADVNALQGTVATLEAGIRETGKATTAAIEAIHEAYDDSDLSTQVAEIASAVEALHNDWDYLTKCDVDSIKSDVEAVKSDVDSMKSDLSTIYWNVSEIKSGIDN